MSEEHRTVGDYLGLNQMAADDHAALATSRYEYLVERRDGLIDRIRFGTAALNIASLAALITLLATSRETADRLGLQSPFDLLSAGLFIAGLIATGMSIEADANVHRKEASDAHSRLMSVMSFRASFRERMSDRALNITGELLDDFAKAPLVDFQFSGFSAHALALGSRLWALGVLIPLGACIWAWYSTPTIPTHQPVKVHPAEKPSRPASVPSTPKPSPPRIQEEPRPRMDK